jgi:hypothetical protein
MPSPGPGDPIEASRIDFYTAHTQEEGDDHSSGSDSADLFGSPPRPQGAEQAGEEALGGWEAPASPYSPVAARTRKRAAATPEPTAEASARPPATKAPREGSPASHGPALVPLDAFSPTLLTQPAPVHAVSDNGDPPTTAAPALPPPALDANLPPLSSAPLPAPLANAAIGTAPQQAAGLAQPDFPNGQPCPLDPTADTSADTAMSQNSNRRKNQRSSRQNRKNDNADNADNRDKSDSRDTTDNRVNADKRSKHARPACRKGRPSPPAASGTVPSQPHGEESGTGDAAARGIRLLNPPHRAGKASRPASAPNVPAKGKAPRAENAAQSGKAASPRASPNGHAGVQSTAQPLASAKANPRAKAQHAGRNPESPLVLPLSADLCSDAGQAAMDAAFEALTFPGRFTRNGPTHIRFDDPRSSTEACHSMADVLRYIRNNSKHSSSSALQHLLQRLIDDGHAIACQGCNRVFTDTGINNHRAQCRDHKQLTDRTERAEAQWVEDADFSLLNAGMLRQLAQPGNGILLPNRSATIKAIASAMAQQNSHLAKDNANLETRMAAFLLLPMLVLCKPRFPFNSAHEANRHVLDQLAQYKRGRFTLLFNRAMEAHEDRRHSTAHTGETHAGASAHAAQSQLARGHVADVLGDDISCPPLPRETIEQVLIPKQFPPLTPIDLGAVAEALDHYAHDDHDIHDTGNTEVPLLTRMDLLIAIRETTKSTGITGIPVKLWDLMARNALAQPILLELVQRIVCNTLPESIRQTLTAIPYRALVSRDQPGKIRAVGSCDATVKIAQRALLRFCAPAIQRLLQDSPEHAVGRKDGLTLMASRVRLQIEAAQHKPSAHDLAVLQLDLSAAFPNTSRDLLRSELARHMPAMLPLFEFLYAGVNTHFILDDQGEVLELRQPTGLVQGSELSSLLFSVASRLPLHMGGRGQHYTNCMSKFMDDMVLVAPIQRIKEDLTHLQDAFSLIGLKLNASKCHLYMPYSDNNTARQHALAMGVQLVPREQGVTVLGVPIGDPAWVQQQLKQRVEAFASAVLDVRPLLNHQATHHMLALIPSLFHHLEAVLTPDELQAMVADINTVILKVFIGTFYPFLPPGHQLPGADEDDLAILSVLHFRSQLPVKHGGLGYLDLTDRCPPAFTIHQARVAKAMPELWKSATNTVLHTTFTTLRSSLGWDIETVDDIARKKVSRALEPTYRGFVNHLHSHLPRELEASIAPSLQPGAGTALLARGIDTARRLSDAEIGFLARQRLGYGNAIHLGLEDTKGKSLASTCALCGRTDISCWDEHLITCPRLFTPRHDAIVGQVANMIRAAGLSTSTEFVAQDTTQQRMDIFVNHQRATILPSHPNWAVDISFTHAARKDNIEKRELDKTNKYKTFCDHHSAKMVPFVMTNYGAMGKQAAAFIREMKAHAVKHDRHLPGVDEVFELKWKQTIACTLAKTQAKFATDCAFASRALAEQNKALAPDPPPPALPAALPAPTSSFSAPAPARQLQAGPASSSRACANPAFPHQATRLFAAVVAPAAPAYPSARQDAAQVSRTTSGAAPSSTPAPADVLANLNPNKFRIPSDLIPIIDGWRGSWRVREAGGPSDRGPPPAPAVQQQATAPPGPVAGHAANDPGGGADAQLAAVATAGALAGSTGPPPGGSSLRGAPLPRAARGSAFTAELPRDASRAPTTARGDGQGPRL